MTFHWQSLDIEGRIEALKAVYFQGASMGDLAARLGVTRQAIAGMYNRHRGKLEQQPLRKPYHPGSTKTRAKKPAPVARVARPVPKPVPKPVPIMRPAVEVETESHLAGVTLMMLQRGQCKWPVLDTEPGEEHLFCGRKSLGSYCNHHKARSTTTEPGWGYR